MLHFQNIYKTFKGELWKKDFTALKGVSFSIHNNRITGFLGANGAGKTTSLKIILGFMKPTSGQVKFDESLGKSFQEILSNIGYFPERPYFYRHLSAREYLNYMGELQGLKRNTIKERSLYWTRRLGIELFLDQKIKNYSKGMQQRLGLCSVLLHDPQLVILDEPLSGLDPIGRQEFKEVFVEINRKGKSLFFSSHIVPDIEEICHDVVVLDKGELLFEGKITDILNNTSETCYRARISSERVDFLEARVVAKHDNYTIIEFDIEKKDKVLQTLVEHKLVLESLEPKRKSLESIVYNLKHDE